MVEEKKEEKKRFCPFKEGQQYPLCPETDNCMLWCKGIRLCVFHAINLNLKALLNKIEKLEKTMK